MEDDDLKELFNADTAGAPAAKSSKTATPTNKGEMYKQGLLLVTLHR